MTTWAQICGISDYSMSLVKYLSKEHEVKIVAPKLTGNHHSMEQVVPDGDIEVNRLFNATIWDGIIHAEVSEIIKLVEWADVFHLQFQDALYHHDWLPIFIEQIRGKAKLVITLHDSCLGKIWPFLDNFDKVITMKPEVKSSYPNAHLIGMPIYSNTPVIKGFGLGRSKHDNIARICEALKWHYEFKKAEDEWLPIEELIKWLRDSDGVVLYYDEVGTAGSSAAARTALSTRRPVFVNNVTWFSDLPENAIVRFTDDEDLKNKLLERVSNDYIEQNSFESIAQQHITLYN